MGLVVEFGDVCEVYYMVVLVGFGVVVINFYLVFELIEDMFDCGVIEGIDCMVVLNNYIKVVGKGVLKVMLKMGILMLVFYIGV